MPTDTGPSIVRRRTMWILPPSISWLSFFITSLAHCFRLGLERSPNRKLTTGLTKGWLGSWRTGRAEPCTAGKAPPKGCVHPPGPDWKLGTWAGSASAGAASAETSASRPAAMSKGLDADLIIVSLPVLLLQRRLLHSSAAFQRARVGWC